MGTIEPVEVLKYNPNQKWALKVLQKIVDTVSLLRPFYSSIPSYLLLSTPRTYPIMAVPVTKDMNNPPHNSERVTKSMLDPDSRPSASPEARLDLGWNGWPNDVQDTKGFFHHGIGWTGD